MTYVYGIVFWTFSPSPTIQVLEYDVIAENADFASVIEYHVVSQPVSPYFMSLR